jgi:hypothetical protein
LFEREFGSQKVALYAQGYICKDFPAEKHPITIQEQINDMQHVRTVLNLAFARMVMDTAHLDRHPIGTLKWERCQRAALALNMLISATTHLNRRRPSIVDGKTVQTRVDMVGRLIEAMSAAKLTSQAPKSKCLACGERMMSLIGLGYSNHLAGYRCLGCGEYLCLTRRRTEFACRSALGSWLVFECVDFVKLERMFWHAFAKYYRRLRVGSNLRMHSVEDRVFAVVFGKRDFAEFFGLNDSLESRTTTVLAGTIRLNKRGQRERKRLALTLPREVYDRVIEAAKVVAPFGRRLKVRSTRFKFSGCLTLQARSATALANLPITLQQRAFVLLPADVCKLVKAALRCTGGKK